MVSKNVKGVNNQVNAGTFWCVSELLEQQIFRVDVNPSGSVTASEVG
jgi:hypothetical protein